MGRCGKAGAPRGALLRADAPSPSQWGRRLGGRARTLPGGAAGLSAPLSGRPSGLAAASCPSAERLSRKWRVRGCPCRKVELRLDLGTGRGVPGVGKRLLGVRCQPGAGGGPAAGARGRRSPRKGSKLTLVELGGGHRRQRPLWGHTVAARGRTGWQQWGAATWRDGQSRLQAREQRGMLARAEDAPRAGARPRRGQARRGQARPQEGSRRGPGGRRLRRKGRQPAPWPRTRTAPSGRPGTEWIPVWTRAGPAGPTAPSHPQAPPPSFPCG